MRVPNPKLHRQDTDGRALALLVASTGGHLKQLHRLRPRLEGVPRRFAWATFDSPQSRALLEGERVAFARYVEPRDLPSVLANLRLAGGLLRHQPVEAVVSTGSGIALSFLPLARAAGIPTHYIESAARGDGPSLTGRLLGRVPGLHAYTQYPAWADDRWTYAGSVFDDFESAPAARTQGDALRVVVTLGTINYPFDRMLAGCLRAIPAGSDVYWQAGRTDASAHGIDAHALAPPAELRAAIREADVVVAHAGVGSALEVIEAGRCPVLVPRQARHGEHVDDHQRQIAQELERRGLAVVADADALDEAHLRAAARLRAVSVRSPTPFRLAR